MGPTRFHYFASYLNWLKLVKSKKLPYLAQKIPNVLHEARLIYSPIFFKKILEQIQYLNL